MPSIEIVPRNNSEGQVADLAPADDGLGFPLYITVRLNGDLPGTMDEMIPIDIMEKLIAQRHLARLDVDEKNQSERQLRFYAQFVFRGMSEFRVWYEAESTKELLEELGKDERQLRLAMDVKRIAYDGAFQQEQGALPTGGRIAAFKAAAAFFDEHL